MAPAPQTVDTADSARPATIQAALVVCFIRFPRAVCYAGAANCELVTKGDCGGKEEEEEERSGATTEKARPAARIPTHAGEGRHRRQRPQVARNPASASSHGRDDCAHGRRRPCDGPLLLRESRGTALCSH